MTIAPKLQALLERLSPEDQHNFLALWEAIYEIRYTGIVTTHCRNGIPQQVDLGAPIRLSIVQGEPLVLDKSLASSGG